MGSKKLRTIRVSGNTYLWTIGHYHLEEFKYSECVDRITIYLKDYKNSPLILHFRLEDNELLPAKTGEGKWFIDFGCLINNKRVINLNRPGVIAKLIEFYVHQNWNPVETTKALEIKDALKLVNLIEFPEE